MLTFKPAVQSAWEEDLKTHMDFKGWQFISPRWLDRMKKRTRRNRSSALVLFRIIWAKIKHGGIKTKNEWVHATNWDCVILDEYHYGAWRENAKELFEAEEEKEIEFGEGEGIEDFDEEIMPITTNAYLYLSGTPFRAIASASLSRSRFTTGHIPMNSAPKRTGKAKTILMRHCPAWCC